MLLFGFLLLLASAAAGAVALADLFLGLEALSQAIPDWLRSGFLGAFLNLGGGVSQSVRVAVWLVVGAACALGALAAFSLR